ncbi:hypothetical protein M514_09381 [Trichuris suis]|uniref:Uncharacterized protein n=1 Tax=Trichuris suis TaxID=68888 RepID=A0A085LXI8_9BILA|nr:hypothetical protein M513_09381 [Trichuris suis]KFD62027.1 hypothetical protein M514_09381 [Trichuris suis]
MVRLNRVAHYCQMSASWNHSVDRRSEQSDRDKPRWAQVVKPSDEPDGALGGDVYVHASPWRDICL